MAVASCAPIQSNRICLVLDPENPRTSSSPAASVAAAFLLFKLPSLFPSFKISLSARTSYGSCGLVDGPHPRLLVAEVRRTELTEQEEAEDNDEKEDEDEEDAEDDDDEEDVRSADLQEIVPVMAGFQQLGTKEKKELRAYAHGLGSRLNVQQVGKFGITQTVVNSISDALEAHEIVKVKVLENGPSDIDKIITLLEKGTGGQVVGKIGRTVLLYRESSEVRGRQ